MGCSHFKLQSGLSLDALVLLLNCCKKIMDCLVFMFNSCFPPNVLTSSSNMTTARSEKKFAGLKLNLPEVSKNFILGDAKSSDRKIPKTTPQFCEECRSSENANPHRLGEGRRNVGFRIWFG